MTVPINVKVTGYGVMGTFLRPIVALIRTRGDSDPRSSRTVFIFIASRWNPSYHHPAFTLMSTSIGVDRIHLATAPLVGFVLWLIVRLIQRAFRNLPPGPKGLPIIGDVFHIADQDWLASPQRKDEYGDIPHSQNFPKLPHPHVPFRRDDVRKRFWEGSPCHQQPTRCHRFT